MARDEWLTHLAQVPMFANCSKKELQAIAHATTPVTLPAGKVLCRQGDVGHECFVITDGSARVDRNGTEVATLGPGAVVGELAPLTGGTRTATVTAATELQVLVMDQRELAGLLDEVPGLATRLVRNLAARVQELDAQAHG